MFLFHVMQLIDDKYCLLSYISMFVMKCSKFCSKYAKEAFEAAVRK
jgi:hypothetical protein